MIIDIHTGLANESGWDKGVLDSQDLVSMPVAHIGSRINKDERIMQCVLPVPLQRPILRLSSVFCTLLLLLRIPPKAAKTFPILAKRWSIERISTGL